MFAMMLSDWERMWKRKKTLFSMLIFVVIVGLDCLFLSMQKLGAFDNVSTAPLVSENFALFLLKEVSFFLVLIIGPMLIIDSMNGEYTSGQLRMVLIRPVSFAQLFLAKWMNLAAMLLLFTLVTFAIGEAFGYAFLPGADTVVFLNPEQQYGPAGAFFYCFQSYGLFYLILLAQLSLTGLICTLLPGVVLSYLWWIATAVGALYVSDSFGFLLMGMDTVFKWTAGMYHHPFYLPLLICLGMGFAVTMGIWQRRGWTK
ncbi:ABC-type transport system involved in multi-copper enzyme maturation permease subunit [Paenibacillus rhizosphaerae]|uniref:ABC-type transport system involved in multi-copper enzyme maturation permease subunit n=1 Tax=Paenibacillus rhizosphaerae TaxID=297318 RepID=A0A839THE1_9BACL|nr:ABC transporter permease [Paenibacillus rhizosphaerae]MBB3126111.1 ABC-type transport system involved in multi-copper enzyme maturation permease subunit [Paenibacillus rhizosphaerae]